MIRENDLRFLVELTLRNDRSARYGGMDDALNEMRLTPLLSEAWTIDDEEAQRLSNIARESSSIATQFMQKALSVLRDKNGRIAQKLKAWTQLIPDEADVERVASLTGARYAPEREKLLYQLTVAAAEAGAYEAALVKSLKFLVKKIKAANVIPDGENLSGTTLKALVDSEKKTLGPLLNQTKAFYKKPDVSSQLAKLGLGKMSKVFAASPSKQFKKLGSIISNRGLVWQEFVNDIGELTLEELNDLAVALGSVNPERMEAPADGLEQTLGDDITDALKGVEEEKGAEEKGAEEKGAEEKGAEEKGAEEKKDKKKGKKGDPIEAARAKLEPGNYYKYTNDKGADVIIRLAKNYSTEALAKLASPDELERALLPAKFSERLQLNGDKQTWGKQFVPLSAIETLEKITPTDLEQVIASKAGKQKAKKDLADLKRNDRAMYDRIKTSVNALAGKTVLENIERSTPESLDAIEKKIDELATTRLNELGLRRKHRLESTIDMERWATLAGISRDHDS